MESSKVVIAGLIVALIVVSASLAGLAYSVLNVPKVAVGNQIENKPQIAAPAASTNSVPSYLYVQNADSGTLAKENNMYKLTLNGVSSNTISFTDRPERTAGKISTQEFIDDWSMGPGSFAADPPNAALVIYEGESEETLVLELLNPVYENGSLQYDVQFLNNDGVVSTKDIGTLMPKGEIPASFAPVALFIDNLPNVFLHESSCNSIGGTWTNGTADSVCTISSDTIIEYYMLIPQGVTLVNNGSISIHSSSASQGVVYNLGTITNYGSIHNYEGTLSGDINNYGYIYNHAEFEGNNLNNIGIIVNSGWFTSAGSKSVNSGQLSNSGVLSITGNMNNSGIITNDGTFNINSNSFYHGTLTNDGTLFNSGTNFVHSNIISGSIINDGTLVNNGSFINDGSICGKGTVTGYNSLSPC